MMRILYVRGYFEVQFRNVGPQNKRTKSKPRKTTDDVKNVLSGLDWLLIKRYINNNVGKQSVKFMEIHQKKLQHLTRTATLPFTVDDVITNLSDYELSDDEKLLLKNAIPPAKILRSAVFTTFKIMSTLLSNLKTYTMKRLYNLNCRYTIKSLYNLNCRYTNI